MGGGRECFFYNQILVTATQKLDIHAYGSLIALCTHFQNLPNVLRYIVVDVRRGEVARDQAENFLAWVEMRGMGKATFPTRRHALN
ncbi:hypothetical protein BDY17DRAFT_303045, partial [Neohortaea acidophila]